MLVDLARNDVGRVVRFGTETVDELMTLERYSHVMHLTSQVSGELKPGKGPIDVLRATLPAGTVSGAPKVRAMEIIDSLEPTKRGPYAGVVGYLDFSGNLDTAIAIRTMFVAADGRASVQAGAGIVADSDPAAEDEECRNKAAALLAAVPAARRMRANPVEEPAPAS
jgi:anthranilate synthase component 1